MHNIAYICEVHFLKLVMHENQQKAKKECKKKKINRKIYLCFSITNYKFIN